jgi:hypothetical protein
MGEKTYWGYATKTMVDTLICDELSEEESQSYREDTKVQRDELNFDE